MYFVDMSLSLPSIRALLAFSCLSCLEKLSFHYMQEILVIRKMQPCLPSFKAEFTQSVPLTRIRDIAHRNDIPHDLKVVIVAATKYYFFNFSFHSQHLPVLLIIKNNIYLSFSKKSNILYKTSFTEMLALKIWCPQKQCSKELPRNLDNIVRHL